MYDHLKISKTIIVLAIICSAWLTYVSHLFLSAHKPQLVMIALSSLVISYAVMEWINKLIKRGLDRFNNYVDSISMEVLIGSISGLLLGILTGVLSSYPLSMIRGIGVYLTLLFYGFSVYMGLKVGSRRGVEFLRLMPGVSKRLDVKAPIKRLAPKVVDTSAIIDGRIYDVCLSNFLEGCLIVPTFVIEELQHIADSSDNIRRNKGRRGLELLSKMQKHSSIKIDIMDVTDPAILEEREVDAKLIRLCKQLQASIITNDYNLNKVAELQGITVLNINELTNAVKMIVYPGETMHVTVIKEGKENGQGVGYLEDGTMVVVEDAQHQIGRDLEVMVTSVFQTAAGRMIFTRKVKEEAHYNNEHSLHDVSEVNMYG
ncbi:MAG: PIN/TRAM domain-containing protein [Syntrophomonadaceae bacterium]|nr:TRAM domain-containing protein [Bacillota bacterium]HQA49484.1 TRAM domain-containing protein [Syntrophomonadaceae bacterium]HQD90874.1 TRAM domain-containing protein [Syntrophomonadaceae bacterium]